MSFHKVIEILTRFAHQLHTIFISCITYGMKFISMAMKLISMLVELVGMVLKLIHVIKNHSKHDEPTTPEEKD